jgi:hypothetical protein
MDVAQIRFYVLDVGQGACNYIEIVDSHGAVTHNMLIDLGTSSAHAVATKNVDWLKDRIKNRPDPRINVMMLTHGDLDHYNLVSKLFPALNPKSTARIGLVRYGGTSWRYRANKDVEKGNSLIKALEEYCANVHGFTGETTNYNSVSKTWTYLWPAAPAATDPKLAILVANVPHPADNTLVKGKGKNVNGVAVNTKSIIYGIGWAGRMLVGTGDATSYTFNTSNLHLAGAVFPPVPMMTMPHHGSRVTTYDLKLAEHDPGDEAIKIVDKFLKVFKPQSVTISANESGHFHPSLYVLNQFSKVTSDTVLWQDPYIENDNHFVTAVVDMNIAALGAKAWPSEWTYCTLQTDVNLYSTMYYVSDWVEPYRTPPVPADTPEVNDDVMVQDAPARGKNWLYTLVSDGSVTLTAWENPHPPTTIHAPFTGAAAAAQPARSAGARMLFAAPQPGMSPSRIGIARTAGLVEALLRPAAAPVGPTSPVAMSRLRPVQ